MSLQSTESHQGVATLRSIISSSRSRTSELPAAGYDGILFGFRRSLLGVDCDEIFPNLFIGDWGAATNSVYLQRIGVTHVLNCAEGLGPGMVMADPQMYQERGIVYMGIPLFDEPWCDATSYFVITAGFVGRAIDNGGRVLVHCQRGISRSSTIVISYLMTRYNMSAALALRICSQKRRVCPNDGFLAQLSSLDLRIHNATM